MYNLETPFVATPMFSRVNNSMKQLVAFYDHSNYLKIISVLRLNTYLRGVILIVGADSSSFICPLTQLQQTGGETMINFSPMMYTEVDIWNS